MTISVAWILASTPRSMSQGWTVAECEFFVKSWRKLMHIPDGRSELVERCSLTGKGCFCEGTVYLTCTRRTFALEYERKHQPPIGRKITVVCSEDNPKMELPST